MACTPTPTLPVPELPFPLSLDLPGGLPSFSGDLTVCCKILEFAIPPVPIPLPPLVLNPAVNAILKSNIAAAQAFLDKLSFSCPKE